MARIGGREGGRGFCSMGGPVYRQERVTGIPENRLAEKVGGKNW